MIDPTRFPRAAAYVASLPNGFDSYPECMGKGSLVRASLDPMRSRGGMPLDLPAPLRQWVQDPPTEGGWVPEVHARALALVVYDHLGFSDSQALSWVFDRNRELLDSRTYRAISLIAFPELLIRGAGLRWGLFHRGSELTTGRAFAQHTATLRYPPALFDELTVRGFGEAIRAILTLSRATDVNITLDAYDPCLARYRIDWKRRTALLPMP